jgi:hypothetical protein
VKSDLPITDPRHPLVMNLTCAEMSEKNWRNIAAGEHRPGVARWAKSNAAFHAAQVERFRRLIEAAACAAASTLEVQA